MTHTQKTYNLILGTQEDGTVVVLDYLFDYGDGFKGAVGSCLAPVTQERIDQALTLDEKTEWYEDAWRGDAGSGNGTEKSLKEWIDEIDDNEYIESRFDGYYTISAADVAAAVGQEEPARYGLTGAGRMFPRKLKNITLIDSDEVRAAVELIHQYEDA